MKPIPPELIDSIIYLITAALGWLARALQGRKKEKLMSTVIQEQKQLIAKIRNRQQ